MESVVEPSLKRWFTQEALSAPLPAVEKARQMIRSTSLNGYLGCAEEIRQLDYLPRLGKIATPALFIVGSEDPGTPPEAARVMHGAVKARNSSKSRARPICRTLSGPRNLTRQSVISLPHVVHQMGIVPKNLLTLRR
jgi:hypothetical protein